MAGFDARTAADPAGGMAGFDDFGSSVLTSQLAVSGDRLPVDAQLPGYPPLGPATAAQRVYRYLYVHFESVHYSSQGRKPDPGCNDYLTSKWLVLIRPHLAGFDRPLTGSGKTEGNVGLPGSPLPLVCLPGGLPCDRDSIFDCSGQQTDPATSLRSDTFERGWFIPGRYGG